MFLKTCFRHLLILCVLLKRKYALLLILRILTPAQSFIKNGDFLHGQLQSADAEQIRQTVHCLKLPIALHSLSLKEVRFPGSTPGRWVTFGYALSLVIFCMDPFMPVI